MIKRTLLAIIALWSTAAAASTLYLLDQIVHSTLYNYGLQFSSNWANPYWLLLRIIQVLLAVNIITTTVSLALTLRAPSRTEKKQAKTPLTLRTTTQIPTATRNVEKPQPASDMLHPSPTPTEATPPSSYGLPHSTGLVTCPNCGKSFTQPLRMLDFQGDNTHLVDTCPFCSKTIRPAVRVQGRE